MGGNVIDFNAFHHSNHLRLLICYTIHFDEKKTVEFVSVAICVRSYRLKTVLFAGLHNGNILIWLYFVVFDSRYHLLIMLILDHYFRYASIIRFSSLIH